MIVMTVCRTGFSRVGFMLSVSAFLIKLVNLPVIIFLKENACMIGKEGTIQLNIVSQIM